MTDFDVVIIGAGPAGLSAALILARSRRRLLVCHAGPRRNAASHAMHGFLSRDGIDPAELIRLSIQQLSLYDSVELREVEVTDVARVAENFDVHQRDGRKSSAKKVLLATGLTDQLPEIEGISAAYGRSVFHCPYCDGWEVRDQPLAIYGKGQLGVGLALELTGWSNDVVLFTNGPAEIFVQDRRKLDRNNVRICEKTIARVEEVEGILQRIAFHDGTHSARRAMFFNLGRRQSSNLALKLGCVFEHGKGEVVSNRHEATNVPGVYVAGDAAWHSHMAIIAASEGAIAALAINTDLLRQDVKEET